MRTGRPRQSLAERFWPRISVRGASECWPILGYRTKFGYAQIWSEGTKKRLYMHRVAWELHFGPIPEDMCVCHSCDNASCCNPAHLFLGTIADNNRDMREKGRNPHGETHPCAKLTAARVLQARQRFAAGERGTARMAAEFGVSQASLARAIVGDTWTKVPSV